MAKSSDDPSRHWTRTLIREPLVLTIIFINGLVLFLDAFPSVHEYYGVLLAWLDFGCTSFFLAELLIRIRIHGFRGFWKKGLNRMDFVIIVASLPSLAGPFMVGQLDEFSMILLLRLGRLLRLFKILRLIPNAGQIGRGVVRSLRASVGVFAALLGVNLILAMGANLLFGNLAPEHFGNPFVALYSMFKVFTVEGWYEIPEAIARSGAAPGWIFVVKLYFIVAVIVGGLLGLSLANAVFVDEMTADNNDRIEQLVTALTVEFRRYREGTETVQCEQQNLMRQSLAELRRLKEYR